METLATSVAVLKTRTCLWACETIYAEMHLLADNIVNAQIMQRKHFAI